MRYLTHSSNMKFIFIGTPSEFIYAPRGNGSEGMASGMRSRKWMLMGIFKRKEDGYITGVRQHGGANGYVEVED